MRKHIDMWFGTSTPVDAWRSVDVKSIKHIQGELLDTRMWVELKAVRGDVRASGWLFRGEADFIAQQLMPPPPPYSAAFMLLDRVLLAHHVETVVDWTRCVHTVRDIGMEKVSPVYERLTGRGDLSTHIDMGDAIDVAGVGIVVF